MATDRLTVLAGAAALGEFTAPELAAFTGVNASTVRQVLRREQKRHGFFERDKARSKPSNGRPAILWRLGDEHRDQVLREVALEEARVAKLRGALADGAIKRTSSADRLEQATMFVSTAEETIARSYEVADRDERTALAEIALNLLRAANPSVPEETVGDQIENSEWWERRRSKRKARLTASLETVSRVSIEAGLKTVQRSREAVEQEELLRRRAHRVAAFAALSACQAKELPIEAEDLKGAAESITAGSETLPVPQTLGWIKIFVDATIASGNPAPVAVLAKSEQSPEEFFPVARGAWRRIPPPAELARIGYSLWVESWAETLLVYSLIPGVVVAHDDSPESYETLTRIMRDTEVSRLGRAVVVASTTKNMQAVAQVSERGGIFYPIRETVEGLLATVNRAVIQALSATPDLGISYLIASDIYRTELYSHHISKPLLDMLWAVGTVVVQPSDLELAQRMLAILDDAVREFDAVQLEAGGQRAERMQPSTYAALLSRLADRLSNLGDSRRALAVTEEVLGNYKRMMQFKPLAQPRFAEIVQRNEIEDNMAWAYEVSSDRAGDSDASDGTEKISPPS
jgi:predicted ArsR family transcriptional regulator